MLINVLPGMFVNSLTSTASDRWDLGSKGSVTKPR